MPTHLLLCCDHGLALSTRVSVPQRACLPHPEVLPRAVPVWCAWAWLSGFCESTGRRLHLWVLHSGQHASLCQALTVEPLRGVCRDLAGPAALSFSCWKGLSWE